MNYNEAHYEAKKRSLKFPEKEYYIIWSYEEFDRGRDHYHVTTDEGLDTFWFGLPENNILSVYRQGHLLS
jgi:hypothetical protein